MPEAARKRSGLVRGRVDMPNEIPKRAVIRSNMGQVVRTAARDSDRGGRQHKTWHRWTRSAERAPGMNRFCTLVTAIGLTAVCSTVLADDLCENTGNLESEIVDCTAAITSGQRYGDNLASAYANRAEARLKPGESDKALADCNEALRVSPHWPPALLTRGIVFQHKDDYARAKVDYDRVIAIASEPLNAAGYTLRGSLMGLIGLLEAAIDDSTRAIAILSGTAPLPNTTSQKPRKAHNRSHPGDGSAFYNRGWPGSSRAMSNGRSRTIARQSGPMPRPACVGQATARLATQGRRAAGQFLVQGHRILKRTEYVRPENIQRTFRSEDAVRQRTADPARHPATLCDHVRRRHRI